MPDFNFGDLGALTQYFQPSEEDKRKAQSAALMAAGFGMLANNTGHYGALSPALGAGGMAGMQMYQNTMQDLPKERASAIANAMQTRKLGNDLQWDQRILARYPALNGSPAAAPSGGGGGGSAPQMPGLSMPNPAPTAPQVGPQNQMQQDLDLAEMLAAAGRPNAAAMQKNFELKYPTIKHEGGVPLDPRTAQPIIGAPIIPQTTADGLSTVKKFNSQTGKWEIEVPGGATESFGAFQDIKNRSAANFGPAREVTLPDGRTQRMTPAQEADFLNGQGQPAATPAASQKRPVYNLVAPDEASALRLAREYDQMGLPVNVTVKKAGGEIAQTAPSPGGIPTSAVINMPGITTGNTNEEKSLIEAKKASKVTAATEGAKSGVALQTQIDEEAQHALEQKRILSEMGNLFQDFDPSRLAPAKKQYYEFRQALEQYGFPALSEKDLNAVSSMQGIAKLNAQLATSAMKQFTNRGTQMEFKTFLQNNPGIEMTPQGAKTIIGFMTKGADLSLKKQQEFSDWKTMYPPDEWQKFNTIWNKKTNENMADTLSNPRVDQAIEDAKNPSPAQPKNLMRGQVVSGHRYLGGDPNKKESWREVTKSAGASAGY